MCLLQSVCACAITHHCIQTQTAQHREGSLWSVRRPLIKLSSGYLCVRAGACVCVPLLDKLIAAYPMKMHKSNGSEISSRLAHATTAYDTHFHIISSNALFQLSSLWPPDGRSLFHSKVVYCIIIVLGFVSVV